jgi:transcription initiation factor TFIID TATA-box-binding protein
MAATPEDSLRIENIVASAKVADTLDLLQISERLSIAEYNKKRFPGVVIRISDPKLAILIFGSGKIVLTGAKSIESLDKGLEYLSNKLTSLGMALYDDLEYCVQNIVTSADLGTSINLNKIAIEFNLEQIEYEPEQFPGLVYRLSDPKVVVLLFRSGKLIITGGKTEEDAKRAVRNIMHSLATAGVLS